MFDEAKMAVTLVKLSQGSKSRTVKVRYLEYFQGSQGY